ncbi:BglG family transcription antiterminator [Salisediminibacterium beveridgei]|uniref:Mannitol operon activator, BglG family n=1 Tax=Salisediminibacterium beveridgei TaxID=632773 RepID=A0A1D7QZ35_9BACI|nr:BglG family transcription antiterminator [Salisediminibacterium beveridgei]AOM84273.1 Mannitol operon activator, BglG family [Salisediminibacterium beveridgei]
MYVSARDRFILEQLIQHPEGVTIREIAHSLQVSERTIHRDLASFDSLLHPYELILEKITSKGIFLKGSTEQLNQFKEDLQSAGHFDFLPEQRQVIIICKLLESIDGMKLQSLATDLNVTVATISSDLEKTATWLQYYGLSLEKRRGFGIRLLGDESSKRKAISGLLAENFNETEILQYVRRQLPEPDTTISESISGQLLGFIDPDKLKQVEQAVLTTIRSIDYPLADSAYIALVVHLTLAIERISKGENISMNQKLSNHLAQKKEFTLAKTLANQLETSFSITIPEAEVGYITMHLRGAKLRQDNQSLFSEDHFDTAFVARQLIEEVGKRTGTDLSGDTSLYQGLAAHLDPALYRVKQGMKIHNPLLEKIKSNYESLFTLIKESFSEVTDLEIPDAEIGFLVLHFGSSMEREVNRRNHEAIVICSSGIGSSKMIATRLRNEFPNIKTVTNRSLFDLNEIPATELDLVISTIPLIGHDIDYVQVNPFLTAEDIRKIEDYIERQEHRQGVDDDKERLAQETALPDKPPERVMDQLAAMDRALRTTLHILRQFSMYRQTTGNTIPEALHELALYLYDEDLIENPAAVTEKLEQRAALSGVGIPGTKTALYHARSQEVNQPLFLVLDLNHSHELKGMHDEIMPVNRLLIMLAPETLSQQSADILSHISALIIANQSSLELFSNGSEQAIHQHLSDELLHYYHDHYSKGETKP